eukprot:ctg_2707.g391
MARRGRTGRARRDSDPERVKLTDERRNDQPAGTEQVDDVEAQWQQEPFIEERDRIALPSWWQGERDPRLLIQYVAVLMGLVLLAALILTVPAIFQTQQPDSADAKAATAASTDGSGGGGSADATGRPWAPPRRPTHPTRPPQQHRSSRSVPVCWRAVIATVPLRPTMRCARSSA